MRHPSTLPGIPADHVGLEDSKRDSLSVGFKERLMATATQTAVGAMFDTHDAALTAVRDLERAGFSNSEIGIVGRDANTGAVRKTDGDEKEAAEGAGTGAAVGAGIGALVGWGVLTGMIPVIGPAIAAGTLGVLLSNAAAGAAIAGVAGTLIGWGIPESDAKHYESELKAGRTLVTVNASDRQAEALRILTSAGGRVKSTSGKIAL
jgi:hypothetical protein